MADQDLEQQLSDESVKRGKYASGMRDESARAKYVQRQGDLEAAERKNGKITNDGARKVLTTLRNEQQGVDNAVAASYRKGGYVRATGNARLHKGERKISRGRSSGRC